MLLIAVSRLIVAFFADSAGIFCTILKLKASFLSLGADLHSS